MPVVALRVVHDVHIPDAEVLVRDVQHLRRQVEGAGVAVVVVLAGAVLHLQVDVRPAVHHAEVPLAEGVPGLGGAAVEDDEVRLGDLLHHQLAHVPGVEVEAVALHKAHDLVEDPVGGEDVLIEGRQGPHAVVLDEDLTGAVLLLALFQEGAGEAFLILHRHHGDIFQELLVVLLVALLAAEEEGAVLLGEAVLQDAVDEVGLAAVQKADDEINRNIHTL